MSQVANNSKNFQVLELIGKGSFASVYKVIRKTDGKIYAMKRVKIQKMSRKEISDTLNEVRFLASVKHAHVVGFYEAFLDNNETELCIIMDFCGCGDLAQKIERYKRRRQYIQEAKIWSYLIQSLRALQVLHQHGICHRDLKAANTFLAEDGSIKIGDMNVSKRLNKQGRLHTQIGTPYYMSPEIWNNSPYDERCDIWSLGCMIYELAALRPPFLGDSFPSLKRSVLGGRYPALPAVFSDTLSAVIAQMLRVSPSQRPSAIQLLALPEVQRKLMQLEMPRDIAAQPQSVMNTIKVPMALKKLHEALPRPCYPLPEVPLSARSDAHSVDTSSNNKENHHCNVVRKAALDSIAEKPHVPCPPPPAPPKIISHAAAGMPPTQPQPQECRPAEPLPKVKFHRRIW